MANKLELMWHRKDEPIRIEPRLLIENTALSNTVADPETENMLIHGDNLRGIESFGAPFCRSSKMRVHRSAF